MQSTSDTRQFAMVWLRETKAGHRGQASDDSCFRRLTDLGNNAFERQDTAAAERHYTEALSEAERLFALAMNADGPAILLAPMVHNLGCHNLSEARRRAGDEKSALALVERAVDRLLLAASSVEAPLSLRINCVRHLKYALAFLAAHLVERGSGENVAPAYLERARSLTLEVMRIAGCAIAAEGESDRFQPSPRERYAS